MHPDTIRSLLAAACDGDMEKVDRLYNEVALFLDFYDLENLGHRLLSIAIDQKNRGMMKVLLKEFNIEVKYDGKFRETDCLLHFAIGNNDIETVRLFLDCGVDVNIKNRLEDTALIHAVLHDRLEIVKLLISKGADVNLQDSEGNSPLHHTALRCEKLAELLLASGAILNAKNNVEDTPLHVAVKQGDVKLAKIFLDHGADLKVKNNEGDTPLLSAAYTSYTYNVELLLDYGADIKAKNKSGKNPLESTIRSYNVPSVLLLISRGVDLNNKNYRDYTPLHVAIDGFSNCRESLKEKLAKKEDSSSEILCCKDLLKITSILINHKADLESRDHSGKTPLSLAADKDCKTIVRWLLGHGSNINTKDDDGNTPLHHAVMTDNQRMVDILLQAGADIEAENQWQDSPIHEAAVSGCSKIVMSLLDSGANINHINEDGNTPLIDAVEQKNIAIVEILLFSNANVDHVCNSGWTALCYAVKRRNVCMVKLLLSHDADINLINNSALGVAIDYARYDSIEDKTDEAREVIEVLIQHVVKMKSQNLPVCKTFQKMIDGRQEFMSFHKTCEAELEKSKTKIRWTDVSYYDILTKGTSRLTAYANNEKVVRALNTKTFKTKFPLYTGMIQKRFNRGMERKKLLDRCKNVRQLIFPGLMGTCTDEIFEFLSRKDLQALVHVIEP